MTDLEGDFADTLAGTILGDHCACYADAWPAHTCANEVEAVGKKIRTAVDLRVAKYAAGWLDEFKRRIDIRLNDHLCEMQPGYDDAVTGFNEAWDVVRALLAELGASSEPRQ